MKLRVEVLEKMLKEHKMRNFSKSEMKLILFLLKNQSDTGCVHNLRCRAISQMTGIGYNAVYRAIGSLESRGLIYYEKDQNHYGVFTLVINGNSFQSYPGCNMHFINLVENIFVPVEFQKLTPGTQLFVMQLMSVMNAEGKYHTEVKSFRKEYKELLGVQDYALQRYLACARKYFDIRYKEKTYWFELKEICRVRQ